MGKQKQTLSKKLMFKEQYEDKCLEPCRLMNCWCFQYRFKWIKKKICCRDKLFEYYNICILAMIVIVPLCFCITIFVYKRGGIDLDIVPSVIEANHPNLFVPHSYKADEVIISSKEARFENKTFSLARESSMTFKKYDPSDRKEGDDYRTLPKCLAIKTEDLELFEESLTIEVIRYKKNAT